MKPFTTTNTIICYGDSNTYGFDPRSYIGDRYPKQIRWTGILEETTKSNVLNYGLNGRSIPHTASAIHLFCEQLDNWQKNLTPAMLWIMLGTNDFLQSQAFRAEGVAERMKSFLNNTKDFWEPAHRLGILRLCLIAPPALQYGAWVDEPRLCEESRRLSAMYQELAAELAIDFVDLNTCDIPLLFDGVHLSQEGHRIVAEKLLAYINNKSR